ncbi:MAG: DUF4426 domain-containing protein [Luteimonas sp.]
MADAPRATVLAIAVVVLAGCSGSGAPQGALASAQAPQEVSVRNGDLLMRASAIPTLALGEAVAMQYGIARDTGSVLLLVGVRRGSGAQETALPAGMIASATDLLGKRQPIDLREVRSGAFVDYAGTVRVIAPDTLRFDIEATIDGGPRLSLQFNRDFFPR